MNCPEKIASIYLRLNGFFLLPHFTLFGEHHTHVDFLALRPPYSKEICGVVELPIDENLFTIISKLFGENSKRVLLGSIVEVKGGLQTEKPNEENVNYAMNFFGPAAKIFLCCFSNKIERLENDNGLVLIPIKYALEWSLNRFEWMNDSSVKLTKSGSWNWSEKFLSDLIYLHSVGMKFVK